MNVDEKNRKRLINSIEYSILQHREFHNKEPNCILLNNVAYKILMQSWLFLLNTKPNAINTIYGMPVRISNEATDELYNPRFWLCEEGTIYNYDMDEE